MCVHKQRLVYSCVHHWDSLLSRPPEFLAVKCRPFYLPREFSVFLNTAAYIPPHANAKLALEELHNSLNSQLNAHPDRVLIVAGDFNHAILKTGLLKLPKNINFPTRDFNILDQVYTNIRGACKAVPAPHLGLSDHISLLMMPSYRPVVCRSRPTTKTVQVWNEGAITSLQHCFDITHWEYLLRGVRPGGLQCCCLGLHKRLHRNCTAPQNHQGVSKPETLVYWKCTVAAQR